MAKWYVKWSWGAKLITSTVTGSLDSERHDIYSDVDLFKQVTHFRKAINSRNWVCVDRPPQLSGDFFYHLFLILNADDIWVREGIIFFVSPGLI